jgi:hypothetical protein
MSGRIRAGDLVVVVRGLPCAVGDMNAVGYVFQVREIIQNATASCVRCHGKHAGVTLALVRGTEGVELSRLQRIDPPAELLRRRNNVELTA